MVKTKYVYWGLIFALTAILIGSVSHLAYTFGSLEEDGTSWISVTISFGIEIGMLGIAFGIAERRRSKKPTAYLTFFLVAFAIVNFYGNFYFAISVYKKIRYLKTEDVTAIDNLILFTAAFLSGCLPLLALALTELQSIFGLKYRQEEALERRNLEKELADKKKEEAKLLSRAQAKAPVAPPKLESDPIEEDEDETIVEAPETPVVDTITPEPTLVDVVARRKAAHDAAVKKNSEFKEKEDNLPKVKSTASVAELAQMTSPQEELARIPIEQELSTPESGVFPYGVFDKRGGKTIPVKK